MRKLFWLFLAFALTLSSAAGAVVPRYETVTLALLKTMDQASVVKMEKDLREIHGYGGVSWDLSSSKCRVTIDTTALCKEDLIAALNQRSHDGSPVVALYRVPPAQESLGEIRAALTSMSEVFGQTGHTRDLIPLLDRMGPHVEALGEAVRMQEPPQQNAQFGPLYEKSRDIAVKVYMLQAVVKRDYPDTAKKALEELSKAVEEMATLLSPPTPGGKG